MAKRQPGRSNGTRPGARSGRDSGRSYPPGGRSSATGRSGKLSGLAVIAAALAGGTYLYLHTATAPHSAPPNAPAVREAKPPAASQPGLTAPFPAAPSGPQEPGASAGSAAPLAESALPLAPFGTSEEVFEAGARLYAANCAGCHGRPGRNAGGPAAAQFWDRSKSAGARAISEPVGALYQATAKGNLTQGMPSYGQRLTDSQIWDLALLIKSAHDDLPDPVIRLLRASR